MKNKLEKLYEEAETRILNSKLNLVDKKTWNYRINNCKKCDFYEVYETNKSMFKCKKCGCPGFRFRLHESKCPLKKPKWR
jgi:predicted nucleic-acid-binding Zn-ribbon protein